MKAHNKTAVVAGVGPGLGAALVRKLAREGCRVAMFARSRAYLEEIVDENRESQLLAVPTDISDIDQVKRGFARVRKEFGPVDILINHASASAWSGMSKMTSEKFERAWRVTTFGAFLCCQEATRDMIARKSGTILFTGATSSIRGRKGALDFSSAKFALRGLADSLARELWPQNIHVAHIIIDGVINRSDERKKRSATPMLEPDDIAETYWTLVEQKRSAWTFELEVRPSGEDFFS
jgi:NAD(P)-dependent dehydrogenase (short-subunit alcohol dehydrogenase family)